MQTVHASPLAIALSALALAGCGGDDGGDGEPEQASTNEALACVQDAGLKALATAGDEPLGITGSLRISVPPENRITVDFFGDPEQAADYAAGQAAFLEPTGGVVRGRRRKRRRGHRKGRHGPGTSVGQGLYRMRPAAVRRGRDGRLAATGSPPGRRRG